MARLGEYETGEDDLFDPWEHQYEDEIDFQKMKAPKVKKVKKEKEVYIKKKKR